jgi:hypothetical protein
MSTPELQEQVQESLAKLHTLADQIRVRIHLGGMDLKDKWHELEGSFSKIERAAEHATADALKAVQDLVARLEELGGRLGKSEPFGGAKGSTPSES